VLRVECDRCFRVVEITRADAMKLWGPHVVLKDLAPVLLRDGCQVSAVATTGAGRGGSRSDRRTVHFRTLIDTARMKGQNRGFARSFLRVQRRAQRDFYPDFVPQT